MYRSLPLAMSYTTEFEAKRQELLDMLEGAPWAGKSHGLDIRSAPLPKPVSIIAFGHNTSQWVRSHLEDARFISDDNEVYDLRAWMKDPRKQGLSVNHGEDGSFSKTQLAVPTLPNLLPRLHASRIGCLMKTFRLQFDIGRLTATLKLYKNSFRITPPKLFNFNKHHVHFNFVLSKTNAQNIFSL